MADRADITPELCRQLLRYEPETGRLFWMERPVSMFAPSSYSGGRARSADWSASKWNTKHGGKEAFTADDGRGYRIGQILGVKFKAHRVVWCLAHGAWPKAEMDHINGERSDNRLTNLREVDASQNSWNKGGYSNNSSGVRGVSWNSRKKQWAATIGVRGRQRHLGYFDDPEAAGVAYRAAAAEAHGEFVRTE